MPPRMMVLGVLAEEPATVPEAQRRLADLFPSARPAHNAAHTNVRSLVKHGFLRLAEAGAEASQHRYEATELGIKHLREWVDSLPPPPVIQEAIHGKLEFGGRESLEALVRSVRAEGRACEAASDAAHGRMLSAHRMRHRRAGMDRLDEFNSALSLIHVKDVALMWADRARRREELAKELEKLVARFGEKAG
jgi:DNA-binding PadR family transcriptional regulator